MNMKVMIVLLSTLSLVGCRDLQTGNSQRRNVVEAEVNHSPEIPIRFETMAETLSRIGTESNVAKEATSAQAIEEFHGKTLGSLWEVRIVTVPHRGDGIRNRDRAVTKKHILAALANYTLVGYEAFHSSTHIPQGTFVKIEYQNGIVGLVNFSGGVPWTVKLVKNGTTGEYGLRNISEQENPPGKK